MDCSEFMLAYAPPAASRSVHLSGIEVPALTTFKIIGLSTGAWKPPNLNRTTYVALLVAALPAASSAATVNVCVPGVLVSSRPPLWIDAAAPSVDPLQLVITRVDEHAKVVGTCWLSVKVPVGAGSGASIVIAGCDAALSGTDWKLTALLKL